MNAVKNPPVSNELLAERLAVMSDDIAEIKRDQKDYHRLDAARYVTQEQFRPIQRIVYSFCAAILLAFLGLLLVNNGWQGIKP